LCLDGSNLGDSGGNLCEMGEAFLLLSLQQLSLFASTPLIYLLGDFTFCGLLENSLIVGFRWVNGKELFYLSPIFLGVT